jgi:hypothetical protein
MRVLLSSSPVSLTAALAAFASTATVEAEYGDVTVSGSALTFAHHGKNAGAPCPCSYGNEVAADLAVEAVGVSHVDLDTLGGVLAIQGRKPLAESFWTLAEYVDLNGAHRLVQSGASAEDVARLHAWWAWSERHRLFAPRDGSVTDAGAWIDAAAEAVTSILEGDPALLQAGEAFRLAGEALNSASFVEAGEGVLLRSSDAFTNHLYTSPSGETAKAVVAYNPKFRSVTVSFEAGSASPVSAREFVQGLWGDLAGGHHGIAGSPREQAMTLDDARGAAEALRKLL